MRPDFRLTAVIPNRNGAHLLPDTLDALLYELPPDQGKVIVVDDASEDHSVEMLRNRYPSVQVLRLKKNVGFGAACNLGFEQAETDLVLLLNSDMLVTAGSLALLQEHFADPTVFAAGPEYHGDKTGPPRRFAGPGPCYALHGAPAGGGLFRRREFLQLGGFDPLYHPFYWEDIDLGWAAWRAGWRIVYDTRARFIHRESATIGRLYHPGYVARVRARNRCLFGWKNFHTPWLRRRHNLGLVRRAVLGLLRRGDLAPLLGLLDAVRMRRRAVEARPQTPGARSDVEILAQFAISLDEFLRI